MKGLVLRHLKQGKDKTYYFVTVPKDVIDILKWHEGDILTCLVDKDSGSLTYRRLHL